MCGDTRMIKLNYTFTEILGSTFQKKFSPSEVQQMGKFSVHKNLLYHVNEDKKKHTHLNKAYCLMNKNAWKITLRILCRPLLKRRYSRRECRRENSRYSKPVSCYGYYLLAQKNRTYGVGTVIVRG